MSHCVPSSARGSVFLFPLGINSVWAGSFFFFAPPTFPSVLSSPQAIIREYVSDHFGSGTCLFPSPLADWMEPSMRSLLHCFSDLRSLMEGNEIFSGEGLCFPRSSDVEKRHKSQSMKLGEMDGPNVPWRGHGDNWFAPSSTEASQAALRASTKTKKKQLDNPQALLSKKLKVAPLGPEGATSLRQGELERKSAWGGSSREVLGRCRRRCWVAAVCG